MRHADRGIRGVHGLAARAGAHEDVDFEILRIDFNLIVVLVGLREHDDARRGGLDASLRFGDGDALHAVHATLVLERRPHAVFGGGGSFGADRQLHVLDAAKLGGVLGLHGDGPSALFGVSGVHAQQIAGEQRGLLAAGAGLDLHDRVARVVGITWNQRGAQLLLGRRQLAFQTLGLLGEIGVLGSHLASRFQIVLHLLVGGVRGDDGLQFRMTATKLAHLVRIGRDIRLGHPLFDIVVFLKRGDRRGELFVCQCKPFLRFYASAEHSSLNLTQPVHHIRWRGSAARRNRIADKKRRPDRTGVFIA